MEKPDDIVGHKTFSDGHGCFRHEPLTRAESDAIMKRIEERDAKWAAEMPDTETALRVLTDAFYRLKQLGWRDAMYAPKDGRELNLISAGSSAAHLGYYRYHNGKDGAGCFWVPDEGDEWPSHPILFRERSSLEPTETQK